MKFIENAEPVASSEFWYDLTDGGHIKPQELLEPEDALKVVEAIKLIQQFKAEAMEAGVLKEI